MPSPRASCLPSLQKVVPGTGAHRANTHADSCTLIKPQILPGLINVLFLESHNGNTGGPGKLDSLGLVFFSDIRYCSKHFRRYNPAWNVGGNGIGLLIVLENGSLFTKFEHLLYP